VGASPSSFLGWTIGWEPISLTVILPPCPQNQGTRAGHATLVSIDYSEYLSGPPVRWRTLSEEKLESSPVNPMFRTLFLSLSEVV
jgi:hypothetical protein